MGEGKQRIKCRWCNYNVPPFYTGKDGKVRSGWGRLNNHIEIAHEDEWTKMQENLGERDDEE